MAFNNERGWNNTMCSATRAVWSLSSITSTRIYSQFNTRAQRAPKARAHGQDLVVQWYYLAWRDGPHGARFNVAVSTVLFSVSRLARQSSRCTWVRHLVLIHRERVVTTMTIIIIIIYSRSCFVAIVFPLALLCAWRFNKTWNSRFFFLYRYILFLCYSIFF